ncbi:DUF58 domain-containing protein [Paenibacillus sp. JX-17]|uniref:DUF58 domain-containing protein n=1 Tax=Paenibacillus lacisoli TaxID=3064525 RepID=A0ABT9CDI4_9BACL|nr:DUF58 domain-containing protein [Paenibacillus sp. JX-17]MDO7907311.1 DUF58 domain-containing protein [Paenibacillus sp. JX-17]
MNASQLLLPVSLLPRLERMSLTARTRPAGSMQGKRRSGALGTSLEFADYRPYTPGDDLRRFDWRVYSRTGKPFVREYYDEQELQVSIYLDCSASMSAGTSEEASPHYELLNKWRFARQLAGCIGYIALAAYERVDLYGCKEGGAIRLPALRGKGAARRLFQVLNDMAAGGGSGLEASLMTPGLLPRRRGMSWLISDGWMEEGEAEMERVLQRLMAAGQEIVFVHVLSPGEVSPDYSGDLRLVDVEAGTGKEVAMTGKIIQAYQHELRTYQMTLASMYAARGMRYVFIQSDLPLEQAVLQAVSGSAGL